MRMTRLVLGAAAMLVAIAMGVSLALAQYGSEPPAEPGASGAPMASSAGSIGPGASGGATVGVTLVEFTVTPDTTTIPAGTVTFDATNVSAAFHHELVIVRTDLAGGELPTLEDGSFDEAGEGVQVVGEVEELLPGTSGSVTVDMTPGHYVLLCNMVVDGLSHYAQGMWIEVEVTGAAVSPGASMAPSGAPVASPM